MARNLAAFDFDHTIIDGNSDLVVRNLVPSDVIPDSVKKLYQSDGWTAYMQGIFEVLHSNGKNEEDVLKAVIEIPALSGMLDLIKELRDNLNFDIIIISDANSYFINAWLEKYNMKDYVTRVFTNPAKFVDGLLRIEMYHLQDECKLSTKNLCKGKILEDYVEACKVNNVNYNKIVYAGDGSNDFCPMLRLGSSDLACVRDQYSCMDLINKVKNKVPIKKTGLTYDLKANVCVWSSGYDILKDVKVSFD